MFERLPPRLQMFATSITIGIVVPFALTGALATYDGSIYAPKWWLILSMVVGAGLASLFKKIPKASQQSVQKVD